MARKGDNGDGRRKAAGARFPGPMSTARFLREYWQKRPLLVRGAFSRVRRSARHPRSAGPGAIARRGVARRPAGGRLTGRWSTGRSRAPSWRGARAGTGTVLVQDTNHFSDRAAALFARFAFIRTRASTTSW